jgi:ParB family chromosome partitioning protein
MKLSMALVPVRKIQPSVSRWNFPEDELDKAAHLVVELEGLVNPIVLRQHEGAESYEVIDGNFEYYVAARACELAPRHCELVGAFIIAPEDEKAVKQQIELLRRRGGAINGVESDAVHPSTTTETRLANLESRQLKLESRQFELESNEINEIKIQLEELRNQLCRRTNVLDVLNQAELPDLLHRLKSVGLMGKNAEKVVEAIEHERRYKPFESLRDIVLRVKGLTYEKMVDLIEA